MSDSRETFVSKEPLFPLGRVVATEPAAAAIAASGDGPETFLDRHVRGDWGDVPEKDGRENDHSVTHEFRIMSSYKLSDGTRVWVITEADRSATTFLLPEEY